jgi:hypothetical protein
MKQFFSFVFLLFFSNNIFAQDNSFRQTYTYEGSIEIDNGQKVNIDLNFLVLLDSTIVGAYYYVPKNGSLKLVGQLNADNTFYLIERNEKDSITGYFNGSLAKDKKTASGKWTSPEKDKSFNFKLNQVEGKSYWDYIKKNRNLHKYTDLNLAIKEKDNVLSIDVADKGIKKLPEELSKLTKIVSINLSGNNFTTFPKVLSKLTTLDEISLSANHLTFVDAEIGNLKNLRILIMNFNQLNELPKELGELTNLLYLELGNNKLKNLPDEVKYLTKLQELHIEQNLLSETEKQKIRKLLPNCVIHF